MMWTWLRSIVDTILGRVPGKSDRMDTATRMAMDADLTGRDNRRQHGVEPRADVDPLEELRRKASNAFAHTCNSGHYVNSSGHWVHSPICPGAAGHHEAICRDGSESHSSANGVSKGACHLFLMCFSLSAWPTLTN